MVKNAPMMSEDEKKSGFEVVSTPLARRLPDFLSEDWDQVRDSGIRPLYASTLSDDEEKRDEFLAGAELLGLVGGRKTLKPQQLLLADALQIHTARMGVCWPRRATKTTTILAVLIGRCLKRPEKTGEPYTVMFSAQSGIKSTARFREWVTVLDRVHAGSESRPYKARLAAGSQALIFPNGSSILVVQPSAESYRGDASDVVWLDEAQEHDADASAELLAGVLPTMDTAPEGAQLIVSGTAGEVRAGILWDTLVKGRDEDDPTGIVEYAADPDTNVEDLGDPALWESVHPGIGTLTTVERVQGNYEAMSAPVFAREYLGLWPVDYTVSTFDSAKWLASEREVPKSLPTNVAFGFDLSYNGSTAAIVAAWRDADGVAHINLVEHRQGSSWVKARIVELSKRYKAALGLNDIGGIRAVREEIERARSIPKSRLTTVAFAQIAPSCSTLLREFEDSNLRHFGQAGLTESFMQVARRQMGDKAWKWAPGMNNADITPVWAATMALRAFDERPTAIRLKAIVA